MKMFYGNIPVNSMKINHYEKNTNDATLKASDMQAGITAYAKGKKVIGTGKAFSFAFYGGGRTNESIIVPSIINTIHIGSVDYPVKMTVALNNIVSHDFTTAKKMAEVIVDGITYPITVSIQNNELMIACEKTINIQFFIGKDEYA